MAHIASKTPAMTAIPRVVIRSRLSSLFRRSSYSHKLRKAWSCPIGRRSIPQISTSPIAASWHRPAGASACARSIRATTREQMLSGLPPDGGPLTSVSSARYPTLNDAWRRDSWRRDSWRRDSWRRDSWRRDSWRRDSWRRELLEAPREVANSGRAIGHTVMTITPFGRPHRRTVSRRSRR